MKRTLSALLAGGLARAQEQAAVDAFPEKPMRIIVTTSAGASSLGFDPATAFAGLIQAVANPQIPVARPDFGVGNFADYIELAREKNGGLLFGLPSPGGVAHIGNELVNQATGSSVTYIPRKGGASAVADLLGGHTDTIIITLATVTEHGRAGRHTAIAVTTAERSKALPDIPTLASRITTSAAGGTSWRRPPPRARWSRRSAPTSSPPSTIPR